MLINNSAERRWQTVPQYWRWALILTLLAQFGLAGVKPSLITKASPLSAPPPAALLKTVFGGDTVFAARLTMLWLQNIDVQTGQFLSYKQLNYSVLIQWLTTILSLDPRSEYPLLAASHLYVNIPDSQKQQQMLDFVYQAFLQSPTTRWRWLAQAALLAKHRLKDLPLALKYATAIAQHATPAMPAWAKEMQIFILEDMGELEQARLIIGGIFASKQLTDPNEIHFLEKKLESLEKQ